jgi:3-deoxy-D-manno-octulosonic-acid transferase
MLDTIGQLRDIYSVATIVFIGGSLIRHGGQNPIEAAIYEKAVIFGPYMFNFKDIAAALLKNYGAVEVSNAADLREKIRLLLQNDSARERFGHNAKRIVSTSGGAARSNLEAIRSIL